MTSPLDTRLSAYRSIQRVAPGIDARVLEAIAANPSTCDEVEVALGMPHTTCSAAVNRLLRSQQIVASGVARRTRAGRKAVVWRVRKWLDVEQRPRETAKERAARLAKELVDAQDALKRSLATIAELREQLANDRGTR